MTQRHLRHMLFVLLSIAFVVPAAAIDRDPLLAVDASSPRDMLQTFQTLSAAVEDTVIAARASQKGNLQDKIYRLMQKLGSLLDLSDVSPAARPENGYQSAAICGLWPSSSPLSANCQSAFHW